MQRTLHHEGPLTDLHLIGVQVLIRKYLIASLAVVTGAVGLLASASPAMAKPVDMWGFAYVDNPSSAGWVTLDPSRQWGTWKTAYPAEYATGVKTAPGRSYVRFPHLASYGRGIIHVTAVDRVGRYCELVDSFDRGGDLIVDVACFKPGGAPDDSRYTVLFTLGSTSGYTAARGGYAFIQYGVSGVVQSDNSTGAPNGAGPISVGRYQIKLPGVGDPSGKLSGDLQVTAVAPSTKPRRCKIGEWEQSSQDIRAHVLCFDALGNLADSEFNVSYHRERSIVATYPPKYFGYVWTADMSGATNYNNTAGFGANSLAPVIGLPGYATVKYPNLSVKETHAQVTATGGDPNYCNIVDAWNAVAPSSALLGVRCFDKTGTPTPQDFFATFTSRI